ncbi:uncharacterized protein LOC132301802 isoform X2 [Cornus florida]|uniref:uncharacterized protein LOC132301802 isoform X2 n=1 Tax=Cornus florida TaxID=4283 RepID=UPI00289848A2|nr:uncharacterized protein LOC132301802 isoform X2 [Cornus florida]
MANPSGTNHEPSQPSHGPSSAFNGPINDYPVPAPPDKSGKVASMNPYLAISTDWNAEEQSVLEDGLIKYASESSVSRYAKIALKLQHKTVRDVALRCKWMTKKENSKRRKEDLARKSKDRKEKSTEPLVRSCQMAARPNFPSYVQGMFTTENDDGNSYKGIGGATGQLLEQNAQYFNQISANFTAQQIHENISLFCQARDNILKILNNLNDMPQVMKQMPQLPVSMNEELANSILRCT